VVQTDKVVAAKEGRRNFTRFKYFIFIFKGKMVLKKENRTVLHDSRIDELTGWGEAYQDRGKERVTVTGSE
jgi:hypothetical protein